jgi:PAS domain S-box-containing protein
MLISTRRVQYQDEESFEVALTDISRQKALEHAFRLDHARMGSLIEGLTAGVFLVDNDGIITEFNLALANLLDLKQEVLTGKPFRELSAHLLASAVEPEVVQQSLERAVTAVAERPVVEIAYEDEAIRYLQIAFFPVWDEDGTALGWGGLVQDVTEVRDRLAWKLELLSILAHDIRTPLATLKGHATALLANYRRWGDEMNLEFLSAMDRTTDELVRQVDRSLALTRVEAGRLGLRPEAVEPSDLIHQSVERAAGSLGDKQIKIDLPDELPKVRADPARTEEVLINLLDNASRFGPRDKPIEIQAQLKGPMIQFSISDYGPGVPLNMRETIFQKYERTDSEGGGTGLGLFIARKIVEAHGGRIWVENRKLGEEGARFSFTLPQMPAEPALEMEHIQESRLASEAQMEGVRALVVEDNPETQALLRAILLEEGYEVEIAPDGRSAIEIFRTSPPNIVLLDWMLPEMDGLLVCRTLRRWSNVPILLITSKTAQTDMVTGLDAGADDYVTKPFQAPELLARMRALLRRGEAWQAEEERDRFRAEGLLIDFGAREAWFRGEGINLTPTEFNLLAFLVRNRGQVLTYDQLIEHLWGLTGERTKHDLFVHVSRLRAKIEPDPKDPRFLRTRWGVGYIFMDQ